MGISLCQLVAKHGHLGVLASETEHGRASYIRMVNVAGKQRAEVVRILPRTTTTSFVQQKLYAIDIGKNPRSLRSLLSLDAQVIADLFDPP